MNTHTKNLYPFCNVCGWRKGGVDSWDGNSCKCGHMSAPLSPRAPYPEHCLTPDRCAGLGSCPRDPVCIE